MLNFKVIENMVADLGIDEAEIDLRKSFLEFSDQDAWLLSSIHSLAEQNSESFSEYFYDHMLNFPELESLVAKDDQLVNLKQVQARYFSELTSGDYGNCYVKNRLKVGLCHRQINLKPKWYFGAYYKYVSYHLKLLRQYYTSDEQKFIDSYQAILKIVCFDMGLAMDAYIYADNQIISGLDQRLRCLIEGIDAIVIEADLPSMRLTYVSPQFLSILGYSLDQWPTRQAFLQSVITIDDQASVIDYSILQLNSGLDHELTYRAMASDQRMIWLHESITIVRDHENNMTGLRSVMVNVTKLKETESQLKYLATHDELTDLSNRSTLDDRMRQAFSHADRYQNLVGVLFIDIDRFKSINDSLGHHTGDHVLRSITERLRKKARDVDTIARVGGDEFVMIVNDIRQSNALVTIAKNLLETISKPLTINDIELVVSASIGISIYPNDGTDDQTLLRHADIAMYRAKEKGRNCWGFFEREMDEAVQRRLSLETNLRNALKNNEFILLYQPQLDIKSKKIVGVEALVRWQSPKDGLIAPIEFIPIAEETGLIEPIGLWVLETACLQAKAWQDAGNRPIRMGINVSARQLKNPHFIENVKAIIDKTGISPQWLEFELTESLLITDSVEIQNCIVNLRELGAGLSIDDFGTGYSSLAYLSRYPITTVKIDKSFTQGIPDDKTAITLTRTIISMCQQMDLQVIAEGVETETQLDFLAQHSCTEIQGYYIGKPVCADEINFLIKT